VKRQKQVFKKAKRMAQSAERKTETGIAGWQLAVGSWQKLAHGLPRSANSHIFDLDEFALSGMTQKRQDDRR